MNNHALMGREEMMKFCWTTINVKDMAASLRFYTEILGLPVTRRVDRLPGMEIAFLGSGETMVELIWSSRNDDASFGKDISLGFVVDSVAAQMELLAARGIPLHSGPFQPNPSVRFIYVLDPDGLKIQFVENIR